MPNDHKYTADEYFALTPDTNEHVELRDVIIAMSACTDSSYGDQFGLPGKYAPTASWKLLSAAVKAAAGHAAPSCDGDARAYIVADAGR